MRPIDQIVIHCTATPNGRALTIAAVDETHRARGFARGPIWRERCNPDFDAVGYHHLIYVNGAVAAGRHHEEVGAHAAGHNAHSIAVALVGTDAYTAAQWRTLRETVDALNRRFPGAAIVGHGSLPGVSRTCPGFSVQAWLDGGMHPLPEHLITTPAAEHAAARGRAVA